METHFSRLLLVVAAALPLGACFLTAEQIAANDDAVPSRPVPVERGRGSGGASLDASVGAAVEKAFGANMRVQCYLDPCALVGDFDGDGKPDQAVLVSDQKNRRGVAVLFGSGASALLGAGHPIGNGGDDFKWAEEWEFVPKSAKQRRDAFTITSESGGGLLSWTKKGFVWTQWGD